MVLAEPRGLAGTVVRAGLLGAVLFVSKLAMAALPNLEPVSLLVMVYTSVLGMQALYPVMVYVVLECSTWGAGPWSISYLYLWPLLVLLSMALRKRENPLAWAVLSAGFGLSFGGLCALTVWAAGGASAALAWWLSGLPFDLLHGAGNFILALVLFRPCRRLLLRLTI